MKALLLVGFITFGLTAFSQTSPVGRWKTIDDKTHEVKSIIDIFEKDGLLYGKVEKIFRKASEDQNPKCDKCSGTQKDQPIIGMQILNSLKKASEIKWSGGEILDPVNGKTYSCKVTLTEDGKKLEVRGFIGFSLLGRTQVWEREPAN